jgi:plasmid stability protein
VDLDLDLDEAYMAALRRRAEQEGRSMEEVARSAINAYLAVRPDRLRAAIARVRAEDAGLLSRLGE